MLGWWSSVPAHWHSNLSVFSFLKGSFTSVRFVLVEPSHPGNVGAVARALKTMGFSQLVIVAPRIETVCTDSDAQAMACSADDVLTAAHIVPTLADALADVHWSMALTAREREWEPTTRSLRVLALQACKLAAVGNIALVFGNERTGLSNVDVERCNALVHIPTNPAYSSLNLAQAVQVLAYEFRMAILDTTKQHPHASPASMAMSLATHDEIDRMFVHLENALIALDFLHPSSPKKLMLRLHRFFARASLKREEVNIVRGIAKHILLKSEDFRSHDR
ncbi:RNA methyltransferase [Candidatus Vallotia cooleyia]|uniref:RNA methyltransferase n=1 Tax=Candidatus Vallotiella adelgis TaxID=1177211 RepID=UPI001D023C9F|nr:RNA methyltransferase [Candidatus Vallotia cooleyia]UDG82308.1 tRNA (cytidine/uridine-2'-O-)-methyltransferase TrmJ [Candidatus Vallotia cooleyia]